MGAKWSALRVLVPQVPVMGEVGVYMGPSQISFEAGKGGMGWGGGLKSQLEERCFLAWAPNLRASPPLSINLMPFPPPPNPTDLDHGSR